MPVHPLRDYAYLLALSVIWGSSFALIKIALDTIPPVSIAAGRIVLAAMILWLTARVAGQHLPGLTAPTDRRTWLHFLAVGMLGNGIPFTLISWGEGTVTSSLAAILIGVMPVFTVVFGRLTGIEARIGVFRLAGVALGFGALVLLMGPALLGRIGGDALLAQLAVAGAAASYAATAVYAKKLTLTVPTLTLAAGTMTASALVMGPAALIWDRPWTLNPDVAGLASVAAQGLFATALAALIYFRLLVSAGPTFGSMVNYLIPAFGAVTGVIWLNESLGPRELGALVLILSAVALVRQAPRLR